jgi:hypothetical protein
MVMPGPEIPAVPPGVDYNTSPDMQGYSFDRPIDENGRIYSQPSGRPTVPYSGERQAIIAESNRLARVRARLQQTRERLQQWSSDWFRRKNRNDYEWANRPSLGIKSPDSAFANFGRIYDERTRLTQEAVRLRQSTQSFARDAGQYAADVARLKSRISTWKRQNPRTPGRSPDSMAEIEAKARQRGR